MFHEVRTMKKRKIYRIIVTAACVLLTALLCVSAVSVCREGLARKSENPLENIYTPEIAAGAISRAAPFLAAFVLLLAAGLLPGLRKERKTAPPRGAENHGGEDEPRERDGKKKKALQAAVLIAAVILIAAGILNGSAWDVLIKAVTICTECVGLG